MNSNERKIVWAVFRAANAQTEAWRLIDSAAELAGNDAQSLKQFEHLRDTISDLISKCFNEQRLPTVAEILKLVRCTCTPIPASSVLSMRDLDCPLHGFEARKDFDDTATH